MFGLARGETATGPHTHYELFLRQVCGPPDVSGEQGGVAIRRQCARGVVEVIDPILVGMEDPWFDGNVSGRGQKRVGVVHENVAIIRAQD